jgi:hypothetical protein
MVELESQIVNSSHLQESNLKLEEMLKEMQEENERMRQQQQTARIQNDLAQVRFFLWIIYWQIFFTPSYDNRYDVKTYPKYTNFLLSSLV